MGSRERILENLRRAFRFFQAGAQKLAAGLTSRFEHSSSPAIIDDDDLEKLKARVDRIRAALESAEELPVSDAFDRLWMRELRDLLHLAEDVLEEIEFESLQATTLEEFNSELVEATDGKRKREEVSLLFYSFPRESISAKIGKIMETYKEIADDRDALRLEKDDGVRRNEIAQFPPSSSVIGGKLHGREEEFLKLHQLVLAQDHSRSHYRSYDIISLVGMPGIGKTAIAQHLCNDGVIKHYFKYHFWVCASQNFDVIEIVKTMLERSRGGNAEGDKGFKEHNLMSPLKGKAVMLVMDDQSGGVNGEKDLSSMQHDLVSRLQGKRVMLVIDDVWIGNKKSELCRLKSNWETLQGLLNHAGQGSKVVFTTQNNEVAKIMGSDQTLHIYGLSDDHWWKFVKASAGWDPNGNLYLEPAGREIIKKCKGLPRAAKAVGEFLRFVPKEQLIDALQSLWSNDEPLNMILPFLRVSYDRLSPHLKCCFVYCSLFPEDYIFEKEDLVRLWTAQGFVELEPPKERHLEDVVGQYFDELVNRCLFQQLPVSDLGAERYMMHGLLHELAQVVASKEILRIKGYQLPEIDEKVRHSSLVPPDSDNQNPVEFELYKEKYLRTFLFLGNFQARNPYYISISDNIFWLIRSLRALDLSRTNITELPSSVNHLIHLRCLSLSETKIEKLPESICGLFKLHTLNLRHCYALNELPQGIKHLVQLCHLELPKPKESPKESHIYVPSEIGKLVGLRKLPVFIIGNAPGCCGVGDLGDLDHLQEKLHIFGLNNVPEEAETSRTQVRRTILENKLKLRKLKLQWSRRNGHSANVNPYRVLEELKPNKSLQELVISGYPGLTFPKWVGDRCFTKIIRVNLKDCGSCEKLPSLGQLPLLKHLTIQLLEKVQTIDREFWGRGGGEIKPFPALETLELREMVNLKEWRGVEVGDFPRLEKLILRQCNELKLLPNFNSVKTLVVNCCEQLSDFPPMASLQFLKFEGFEKMENLPQLSNLATLEQLDVVDCKQLSGVSSIQHLVSLQQFNVVKCPVLCISADDRLPLTLQLLHIGADCPMLGQWKLNPFEEVENCDEGCRKLVRREEHAVESSNSVPDYNTGYVDSGYFHTSNKEPTENLLPSLSLLR